MDHPGRVESARRESRAAVAISPIPDIRVRRRGSPLRRACEIRAWASVWLEPCLSLQQVPALSPTAATSVRFGTGQSTILRGGPSAAPIQNSKRSNRRQRCQEDLSVSTLVVALLLPPWARLLMPT